MNKRFPHIMIVLTLVAVLAGALAFSTSTAKAENGTFNVSVYHDINGRNLGLSRELPVIATVSSTDGLYAVVPLKFKDRFSADLPAGTYTIMVSAVINGSLVELPSMSVGPVTIPADVDVRLIARLKSDGTPYIKVRVQ